MVVNTFTFSYFLSEAAKEDKTEDRRDKGKMKSIGLGLSLSPSLPLFLRHPMICVNGHGVPLLPPPRPDVTPQCSLPLFPKPPPKMKMKMKMQRKLGKVRERQPFFEFSLLEVSRRG